MRHVHLVPSCPRCSPSLRPAMQITAIVSPSASRRPSIPSSRTRARLRAKRRCRRLCRRHSLRCESTRTLMALVSPTVRSRCRPHTAQHRTRSSPPSARATAFAVTVALTEARRSDRIHERHLHAQRQRQHQRRVRFSSRQLLCSDDPSPTSTRRRRKRIDHRTARLRRRSELWNCDGRWRHRGSSPRPQEPAPPSSTTTFATRHDRDEQDDRDDRRRRIPARQQTTSPCAAPPSPRSLRASPPGASGSVLVSGISTVRCSLGASVACSASANSAAVWNRSSGRFANAFNSTRADHGGTRLPDPSPRTNAAGRQMPREASQIGSFPVIGFAPVSSS